MRRDLVFLALIVVIGIVVFLFMTRTEEWGQPPDEGTPATGTAGPPAAVAAYVPWICTGKLVMTSGQLPWRDGQMAYAGKLGADVEREPGHPPVVRRLRLARMDVADVEG